MKYISIWINKQIQYSVVLFLYFSLECMKRNQISTQFGGFKNNKNSLKYQKVKEQSKESSQNFA